MQLRVQASKAHVRKARTDITKVSALYSYPKPILAKQQPYQLATHATMS